MNPAEEVEEEEEEIEEGSIYLWLNTSSNHVTTDKNGSDGGDDIRSIKYVVMTFYLATFLFGVLGNSLVMVIIFRFPKIRSRSVTNYYIWNLSLADELFVLTLPFFCYATYTHTWVFGDAACRLAFLVYECNKFASLLTLTAISADRLLASFHHLGRYRLIRVGVAVCVGIWVVCLLGSTPYLLYGGTVPAGHGQQSCKLSWPSLGVREAWIYLQLIFGFLLPLLAVVVFNVLLLRRLTVLNGSMVASVRPGSTRPNRSSMARMVLTVVGVFFVCQVPYHVVEVISVEVAKSGQRPNGRQVTAFRYCNALAQVLVFFSSCCNPIIYGIFNKNYRKLYKEVVFCCFARKRQRSDSAANAQMAARMTVKRQRAELERTPLPVTLDFCYSATKDTFTLQCHCAIGQTTAARHERKKDTLSNSSL